MIALYARLRSWQGFLCRSFGDNEGARRWCQAALDVLEGSEMPHQDVAAVQAFALVGLGRGYSFVDRKEAERLTQDGLSQFQRLGDLWGGTLAHGGLGSIARDAYDNRAAESHFWEAWQLSRQSGNMIDSGWTSLQLGWDIYQQGRFTEAEEWLWQGVELCRQYISDWPGYCAFLINLADTLIFQGRYQEAGELQLESARVAREHGWYGAVNEAHCKWSHAMLHLGRYQEARRELETTLASWQQQQYQAGVANCQYLLAMTQMVTGANGKTSLMLQESAEFCRETNRKDWLCPLLVAQAILAAQNDQLAAASHLLREALEFIRDIDNRILAILAIPALALYHAAAGAHEIAAELYAMAAQQPFVANSAWYQAVVGNRIAADELPPAVKTAAENRGRARDLRQTIGECLAALAESGA